MAYFYKSHKWQRMSSFPDVERLYRMKFHIVYEPSHAFAGIVAFRISIEATLRNSILFLEGHVNCNSARRLND